MSPVRDACIGFGRWKGNRRFALGQWKAGGRYEALQEVSRILLGITPADAKTSEMTIGSFHPWLSRTDH